MHSRTTESLQICRKDCKRFSEDLAVTWWHSLPHKREITGGKCYHCSSSVMLPKCLYMIFLLLISHLCLYLNSIRDVKKSNKGSLNCFKIVLYLIFACQQFLPPNTVKRTESQWAGSAAISPPLFTLPLINAHHDPPQGLVGESLYGRPKPLMGAYNLSF